MLNLVREQSRNIAGDDQVVVDYSNGEYRDHVRSKRVKRVSVLKYQCRGNDDCKAGQLLVPSMVAGHFFHCDRSSKHTGDILGEGLVVLLKCCLHVKILKHQGHDDLNTVVPVHVGEDVRVNRTGHETVREHDDAALHKANYISGRLHDMMEYEQTYQNRSHYRNCFAEHVQPVLKQ